MAFASQTCNSIKINFLKNTKVFWKLPTEAWSSIVSMAESTKQKQAKRRSLRFENAVLIVEGNVDWMELIVGEKQRPSLLNGERKIPEFIFSADLNVLLHGRLPRCRKESAF
jgi:hypothetical protein